MLPRYSSSKSLQPLFPAKDSNEQPKLYEDTNTSHLYGCKNQNQENITTLAISWSGQKMKQNCQTASLDSFLVLDGT
ncbi:Response regulator receiver [Sesbania bispinosa]|nr:Response regulator receiver [Sesbania bispinosa]